MSERRYPVPKPEQGHDPRFTFGLIVEVADVLERHGYPAIGRDNADDHVELSLAVFRFIYTDQGKGVPAADAGDAS